MLSIRGMVLGDEKVAMLIKSEKQSKKRYKNDSTKGLGVTKGDVKAVKHDLSFKEEKLAFVETRKERDKTKMETGEPGKSEDCDIKNKKERGGGSQSGKSCKVSCKNAIKNDVKKNKLKNERVTVDDALLDTKTIVPETASETCDTQVVMLSEGSGGNVIDMVKRKKRKKGNRKKEGGQVDIVTGVNEGDVSTSEEIEESRIDDANISEKKKTKLGHSSKNLTHEKSEKRVRFSGHVQVFPPSSESSDEKNETKDGKMLNGKRFTQEEDEIVKGAVYRYIEVHNLGEEGLHKVLNPRSSTGVRGCWKKIARALPYRPYIAVYHRAQVLFHRGEKRKWTENEYEMIRKFHGEHGTKWRALADELGRHWVHIGQTWLRIKLDRKRGNWSQDEIQTLFDLVNTDLQSKLSEEKKSKHGMLRDNISWSAISDKLTTRDYSTCCNKWYKQLTSPMVATGDWADTDDYRLIDALFELDASCIEDVDWDNLLDYRTGELCRKRWNQMVRQLSKHENKSFAEQVELLANRYRPDLVGAREVWDRKPVVP